MTVNTKQLQPYLDDGCDLIPIHVWNKQIKGKERGKTPVDFDWPSRTYTKETINKAIKSGRNMGFRIGAFDLVVDMDPRNYDGVNVEEMIAELFGYFDMDEMLADNRSVKTGGGGYHIYYTLPEDVDYMQFVEVLDDYPGVEFKRKGRQVLCAGSKHPSGNYYKWITIQAPRVAPIGVIETITRTNKRKENDYVSGAGALTGPQLDEMILSKLDPEAYQSNDEWFPLLCGAHHATNGDGIEEFVEWSTSDSFYGDCETEIRSRWESLWEKPVSVTIGTLIRALEKTGEDSSGVKAALDFAHTSVLDEEDAFDEDEMSDFDIGKVADDIDTDDLYAEADLEGMGVEGAAMKMAKTMSTNSTDEDIMKCLRLIKAADVIETNRATEELVARKVMSRTAIAKLLKSLDSKLADDMGRLLAEKTLKNIFNNAKHLMLPPNGQIYSYGGKYWSEMSEEFLGKILTQVYDKIKAKMDITVQENSLILQSANIIKRLVATHRDRLHTHTMLKGIINCSNGELHITPGGGHELRPHSYRSGLLNCLDVQYNPAADCPLFIETLEEIFANYPDTQGIIRHLGEMLGYCIQPNKDIASWWLFRGPGGDGKSTILAVLGGILGDSQIKMTTKVLSMGEDSGSSNHTSANLVGKLNVVIEELPAGYLLKDAGLKMLGETTKMEANPKFGRQFSFMYCGALIMCSNGYPATRDLSHGMQRRANIIPFNRQFTLTGEADRGRVQKILGNKEEMSGVLNFMLEGLQRLRDRGDFKIPNSCAEAKLEWSGESNHTVRFVRDALKKVDAADAPRASVPLKDVYLSYSGWCLSNAIKPKGKNTIKNELVSLGYVVRPGGANVVKVFNVELIDLEFDEFDVEDL